MQVRSTQLTRRIHKKHTKKRVESRVNASASLMTCRFTLSLQTREVNFVFEKKGLENPFWWESRTLTFVVQLRFAPTSVMQSKGASVGFCRS